MSDAKNWAEKICPHINKPCIKEDCLGYQVFGYPPFLGYDDDERYRRCRVLNIPLGSIYSITMEAS